MINRRQTNTGFFITFCYIILLIMLFVPVTELENMENLQLDNVMSNLTDTAHKPDQMKKLNANADNYINTIDFLPGSNFSITQYQDNVKRETFNSSVLSANTTHWQTKCNYSIEQDANGDAFSSPFISMVNKQSVNRSYLADNFYSMMVGTTGLPTAYYEFWMNVTSFTEGYEFSDGQITSTVEIKENITLANVGTIPAWKIVTPYPELSTNVYSWYSHKKGLLLSLTFDYISTFCYNLTDMELNTPPTIEVQHPLTGDTTGDKLVVEWVTSDAESRSSLISQDVYVYQGLQNVLTVGTNIQGNGSHSIEKSVLSLPNGSDYYIVIDVSDSFITKSFNTSTKPFEIAHPSAALKILVPKENKVYQSPVTLIYEFNESTTNIDAFYIDGVNQTNFNSTTFQNKVFILTEGEHNFSFYVTNNMGIKQEFSVIFSVDNTAPVITINDPQNKTYRQNSIFSEITLNELANISYSLDGSTNSTLSDVSGFSKKFSNLTDGSHYLTIRAVDKAGNEREKTVFFTVYTSTFGIYWTFEAKTPKKLRIVDETGKEWFQLTITSRSTQNITFSLYETHDLPDVNDSLFVVYFHFDKPDDILFMTFEYNDPELSDDIGYNWLFLNNKDSTWQSQNTQYNPFTQSWEVTVQEPYSYVTLAETEKEEIVSKSNRGAGIITPGFTIQDIILPISLIMLFATVMRNLIEKRGKRF